MTLDATARSLATKLISSFGKSLTLTRVTEGTYDTATGTITPTETTETVYGVIEEYSGNELSSGMIERGDKKITVAASGLTKPSVSDKIAVDSETFLIVRVGTVYGGSLAATYELQGRKA